MLLSYSIAIQYLTNVPSNIQQMINKSIVLLNDIFNAEFISKHLTVNEAVPNLNQCFIIDETKDTTSICHLNHYINTITCCL